MNFCYAQASLVVSRAGASTLAELASVGRAAIFIPLPTAADNHQEKNSRIFAGENAAWGSAPSFSQRASICRDDFKIKGKPARYSRSRNARAKILSKRFGGPNCERFTFVNLERVFRLHFIGIGGIGMSGIAEIFLAQGQIVSGIRFECG